MVDWIDSYTQLLSGEEIDDRDISRAAIIKACNLPSHIYKFRPVNDYSLQNLRDSTVWAVLGRSVQRSLRVFGEVGSFPARQRDI